MRAPNFPEGVLVAAILAVSGEVLFSVVPWFLNRWQTLLFVSTWLTLVYQLYLLRRAPERSGRITFISIWALLSLTAWAGGLPVAWYLMLQLGCIWLVRALYFRIGPLAALADLGVHGLAAAGAMWAFSHSGSMFLSLWSFFLCEALFPLLQGRSGHASGGCPDESDIVNPRFELAHRTALSALQRLTKR